MKRQSIEDDKPWYRQFWPWFLIALPGSVVIAGLTTVYIAFKGADNLVNDNYYRDGLAINQRLEQDQQALQMGLSADVRVDNESGELFIMIRGSDDNMEIPNQQLFLQLLHPTDEKRDQDLVVTLMGPNRYRVDLEAKLSNRYYLRLLPEPDREWRLNGEMNFSDTDQMTMRAQ